MTRLARRRDADDARILAALTHGGQATSYDIWYRTGLRTGRQRRALDRLARAGLVAFLWSHGEPPVRMYAVIMPGRPPTRPMVLRESP